jgi:hypothetical protein
MNRLSRMQAVCAAALLVFGISSIARADGDNNNNNSVRLRARMTGQATQTSNPEGNADFRIDGTRTRLQVEVEHANLPAGTVLVVMLQHGTAAPLQVGMITLSANGSGELELDSQDGAIVPAVQVGDVASVTSSGAAILAGAFATK